MDLLNVLSNIGFDWKLALANLVNFLIIYYLLKKFAFEPIGKIINERKQKIEEGLTSVKRAEEKMLATVEESEKIIGEARHESNMIVAKGHDQAKALLEHANVQAVKEREELLTQARLKIESEQKEMEDSVRTQTADLIVHGAEKVLGEEISGDTHKRVIDRLQNY